MNTLEIKNLSISFPDDDPYDGVDTFDTVLNHMNLVIESGEVVGLVGESGSGKSMTALAVMGLLKPSAIVESGTIEFEGTRGVDMTMIFQEPMTSLNPLMKIGRQAKEAMVIHKDVLEKKWGIELTHEEMEARVENALLQVGLDNPKELVRMYPHELSGGMRQRVMIAMAMLVEPKLLIADEPTTALDAVVQSEILELLKELNRKTGVSILFISHDLSVIRRICNRVLVMYKGNVVEEGECKEVFEHPQHDYTKTLVSDIPLLTTTPGKEVLLEAEHLNVYYEAAKSGLFKKASKKHVVKDASFTLHKGEILGIVGESGSGKSTLVKAIVGMNSDYDGVLRLASDCNPQMVFQDPYSSLNPAHTIGWTLREALRAKRRGAQKTAVAAYAVANTVSDEAAIDQILERVGLEAEMKNRYPRDLSGGQRQRVCIAEALLLNAGLLILDEPVSALDVTVASQILRLILSIHEESGISMIFISHNIHMVRRMCHSVLVLKDGCILEQGQAAVLENPKNEYTKKLVANSL